MMLEIRKRARRAEPVAVVASRVKTDTGRSDASRDQSALGRTNHTDSDVGVAARQVLVAIGDGELDRDARMSRMKPGEYWREHFASDDLARRHANHASIERGFR